MERELSESRPLAIRLELQDPSEFVLAASGPDRAWDGREELEFGVRTRYMTQVTTVR